MRNVESKVARTHSRINTLNDCAPSRRVSDVSPIFLHPRLYILREIIRLSKSQGYFMQRTLQRSENRGK